MAPRIDFLWRPHPGRLRLVAATICITCGLFFTASSRGENRESKILKWSDAALDDTFTQQDVTAKQPRRPDGGYDWEWRGPKNDPEWAWFFNRHYAFNFVLETWQKTGDKRYRDWVLATLDDWILQHPAPGRMTFSSAWRPLEAARRILGPWTLAYRVLNDDPAFTPERRERFLTSIQAHGEQLRHHHALFGNHLITEMLALAQLCVTFPANKNTDEWLTYSLDQLEKNYRDQVYPDGAYKELSTHYQVIVALNYQQLLTLLTESGRLEEARHWKPAVDRLWAYLQAVQKPDGSNPLTNDSDSEDLQSLLRRNAPHLATIPSETTTLPYAGQTVFRSGDQSRAQWAFFDHGPRGTAHQHDDHLQFSLSLGQRDFLVDNGRYTYSPGPWRDYFAGATGHNVLLLDGHASDQGPDAINPCTEPASGLSIGEHWETASGDTRFALPDTARAADWRRIVINLRGNGWIVLDRLVTFAPHRLETLWHWHPDCEVTANGPAGFIIRNHEEDLSVSFASTTPASLTQVSGSKQPVQGWHSQDFNTREPATCTIGTQQIDRPTLNAWLFTPGNSPATLQIKSTTAQNTVLTFMRGDQAEELIINLDKPGDVQFSLK